MRDTGSLLLVRGDDLIEIQLSPMQLMTLALDAMAVATRMQPGLMESAVCAFEQTMIVPAAPEGECHTVN